MMSRRPAAWLSAEIRCLCIVQKNCSTSGGFSIALDSVGSMIKHLFFMFYFCLSFPLSGRLLLLNQFHDVIPGSCIGMVVEDAINYYKGRMFRTVLCLNLICIVGIMYLYPF